MMIKIFIDSSVLIAGLISDEGASSKILSFCESKIVEGWISSQVIKEVEENIKRKIPQILNGFQKLKLSSNLKILKIPNPSILEKARKWIKDKNDAPILAAAKQLDIDVLLTLDLRHFIKDTNVSKKSELQIMTPGEFLKGFIKFC
ncbi:MAG: putative toxin-antitoxin system toxin component, PIN family [Patescibacteria group bacterium]